MIRRDRGQLRVHPGQVTEMHHGSADRLGTGKQWRLDWIGPVFAVLQVNVFTLIKRLRTSGLPTAGPGRQARPGGVRPDRRVVKLQPPAWPATADPGCCDSAAGKRAGGPGAADTRMVQVSRASTVIVSTASDWTTYDAEIDSRKPNRRTVRLRVRAPRVAAV